MRRPGQRPVAMKAAAPLLAVLVLLVAGVAAPAAGSVADPAAPAGHAAQAETATPPSNGSDEASAPGARFAGVVDVQEAEVESELEGRAFDVRVANANSDASKAAVVAESVDELSRRTETLRERKRALAEARENGSISEDRYRAEVAALAARSASVERRLERAEATSNGIPADVLESRGVNVSAIQALRNESRTVAGSDAADIARSIAGDRPGGGLVAGNASPGRPVTPPGGPGNRAPSSPGSPTPTNGSDGNGPGAQPAANATGPPSNPGSSSDQGHGNGPGASSDRNGTTATPTPDMTADPATDDERGPPADVAGDTVSDVLSSIVGTTADATEGRGPNENASSGRGPPSSPRGRP